jgi:hypothetical protein
MQFTLDKSQLEKLQKYHKVYSYFLPSFTKTYFSVGEGSLKIFFHGAKGALETEIECNVGGPKEYFQTDYAKWINAISKLIMSDTLKFNLTEKFIKVSVEGSVDVINLGVVKYKEDSSEAKLIDSYLTTKTQGIVEDNISMELFPELVDALSVACSLFTTVGNNNAVSLRKDSVMYADRSIILKALFSPPLNVEEVILHKFTAGAMLMVYKHNGRFLFGKDYSTLAWDDGEGTRFLLASEPCDISLPTEDEIKGFAPEEGSQLVVDHKELLSGLQFFEGFYEASAWKPIVFKLTGNKEAQLYYSHPTTEIHKNLIATVDTDGEFIIGSETLGKLVSKSVDKDSSDIPVVFHYDQDSPGVACKIGDLYQVVFAKLVE